MLQNGFPLQMIFYICMQFFVLEIKVLLICNVDFFFFAELKGEIKDICLYDAHSNSRYTKDCNPL